MQSKDTHQKNLTKSFEEQQFRARSRSLISTIALIVSNLVPIWGVLVLGWVPTTILKLYWVEFASLSFFTIIRIAIMPRVYIEETESTPLEFLFKSLDPTERVRWGAITFFGIFYGMFLVFFSKIVFPRLNFPIEFAYAPAEDRLGFAYMTVFLCQGISCIFEYIRNKEYRNADLLKIALSAHRPMLIFYLSLCFGIVLVGITGLPQLVIIVFSFFKLAFDVFRSKGQPTQPSS